MPSIVSMLKSPCEHVRAPSTLECYVNAKAMRVIKKNITDISVSQILRPLSRRAYSTMDVLRMVDNLRVGTYEKGYLTVADCSRRLSTIKAASHLLESMRRE